MTEDTKPVEVSDEADALHRKMKAMNQHFLLKYERPMHKLNFPRNQRKIRKNRRRSWAMGNKNAFKK